MTATTPVVLVSIDGLRPDALAQANCPHLAQLRERGAWTLRAHSLMPSVTLPVHTSIFYGVSPARHGVKTNDWQSMARPVRGIVDVAHAAGLRTAFIYNWGELRDMCRPGSLDYAYFNYNYHNPGGDQVIAEEAVRCLAGQRPDLAFVYFGSVDQWGHDYGFMSDEYLAQLVRVDAALGTLLSGLPGESRLLVVSDHGGHGRQHGDDIPEDMTVPWIVAGPGVRHGHEIRANVSLLDCAPTLAHFLGVAPEPEWEGRVVDEAFETP
jgi:predicted AlkP superfamily pyrophosphatase or phosphodiesterase